MATQTANKTMTNRVARLKQSLINMSQPVATQHLRFLMDTYRENEGQPEVIKRARLLEKHLTQMSIFIDDNPVVGTNTELRGGVQPMPEWSCRWMKKQIEKDIHFRGQLGALTLTDEDKRLIVECVDYWQDRCVNSRSMEIVRQVYGRRFEDIEKSGVWGVAVLHVPLGFATVDYEKVLREGFNGIIADVEGELARLPLRTPENLSKRQFLEAVLICLRAVPKFAQRYAVLARDMAAKETDAERKKELLKIAETCEWVPANPPRNFSEAIQSFWFTHAAVMVEYGAPSIVPGRFARYMYPFYKKDKDEGKITEETSIELLHFLFIKFLEMGYFTPATSAKFGQGLMNQFITLGGVNADGTDASNELDILILEAQRRFKGVQPSLCVLYHDKLPEEFLVKCIEVIRDTGLGQPAFYNNDVAVERNLFHHPGMSMEDARDIELQGCVHTHVSHATDNVWEGLFNMPKVLELALNNGKDPMTGLQAGPQTGDADKFRSYDELLEAFKKQIQYFLPIMRETFALSMNIQSQIIPMPYQSALVDDCIKLGKDVNSGGARYDASGVNIVATIDAANSLATIKKLVFEEKRITMKELKEALKADFEGYEEIHRMCMAAPKYGNDGDYVEPIAKELFSFFWDEHAKIPDRFGRLSRRPECQSIATHFGFGRMVGALPCGRKARLPLTDGGVSAMPGTDTMGPTALVNSAARVADTVKWGSTHLNMKFHPSALSNRTGMKKLVSLIKTYMDLGGHHMQFNCVTRETLLDAQLHPQNYRDLVVRVAGFSAFYIHLDKEIQDEIIKRTEYRFE